jgi:serine/threonine protein phosphatase PrpC
MARAGGLKAAAHAVVKEAYARGSTDNISVIVVSFFIKE